MESLTFIWLAHDCVSILSAYPTEDFDLKDLFDTQLEREICREI